MAKKEKRNTASMIGAERIGAMHTDIRWRPIAEVPHDDTADVIIAYATLGKMGAVVLAHGFDVAEHRAKGATDWAYIHGELDWHKQR